MQIPSSNPLVLCIDDERVGLEVRRLLLERSGFRVITAQDGKTGLTLFENNPVEAVVLDFAMPGMDGGEVAAAMRTIKPEVPLVLLSAYLDLAPEITSLVNVYMTKAEGAPALIDRVRSLFTEA